MTIWYVYIELVIGPDISHTTADLGMIPDLILKLRLSEAISYFDIGNV